MTSQFSRACASPGTSSCCDIALVNLLENAFKFTRHTTNPRVEISGRLEGENLSVQVRDNGAGFDPEYADRLFRPFERLHAESEFAGTGIGLTTVERVIRRHGGSITASGAPGRGASFSCTLRQPPSRRPPGPRKQRHDRRRDRAHRDNPDDAELTSALTIDAAFEPVKDLNESLRLPRARPASCTSTHTRRQYTRRSSYS